MSTGSSANAPQLRAGALRSVTEIKPPWGLHPFVLEYRRTPWLPPDRSTGFGSVADLLGAVGLPRLEISVLSINIIRPLLPHVDNLKNEWSS